MFSPEAAGALTVDGQPMVDIAGWLMLVGGTALLNDGQQCEWCSC